MSDDGPDRRAVLIVDDEVAIVETLSEILSFAGYDVETACDGKEGLAALERRPATVLLDFMMPVMDGLQLLRVLRADARLGRLPVILMSAAGLEAVRAAARVAPGADGPWDAYLAKPFEPPALFALLDELRNRKKGP